MAACQNAPSPCPPTGRAAKALVRAHRHQVRTLLQRVAPCAAGDDPAAQMQRLYLLALSRPPRVEELEIGLKLLDVKNPDALRLYCHLVLGLNEMIYVN